MLFRSAINESLSDVFGELLDLTNGSGTDTADVRWHIGEDLALGGSGAFRSMAHPPAFDQPDRMTSSFYTADTNEQDRGGVHTNSGVNNKAAFLLVDGGTFNGRSVSPLGITKTARLYYEVQTNLLTSAADYLDLSSALQQACIQSVGVDGIMLADCDAVNEAIAAVEMALPQIGRAHV